MNLLIDTHALIWFITDSKKLPSQTKKLIKNEEHNCFVSIASLWEISIKNSIGRLDLNADLDTIFEIVESSGFQLLPITRDHTLEVSKLDFYHQDPFDRMLIAQAHLEKMAIVSKDAEFNKYKIPLIWEN